MKSRISKLVLRPDAAMEADPGTRLMGLRTLTLESSGSCPGAWTALGRFDRAVFNASGRRGPIYGPLERMLRHIGSRIIEPGNTLRLSQAGRRYTDEYVFSYNLALGLHAEISNHELLALGPWIESFERQGGRVTEKPLQWTQTPQGAMALLAAAPAP